ncbi:hypothetical protein GJ496_001795 [Pomphorhynchus laevis]|nr:hypothetical protein GJ496_001795 [Pomphorhynchus laevis]
MPKRPLKSPFTNNTSSKIVKEGQEESPEAVPEDNKTRQESRPSPKRILYTRFAKTAAKDKIERCLNPKAQNHSDSDQPNNRMNEDTSESSDDSNNNTAKRSRSHSAADPTAPPMPVRSRMESPDERQEMEEPDDDEDVIEESQELIDRHFVEEIEEEDEDDDQPMIMPSSMDAESYMDYVERAAELMPIQGGIIGQPQRLNIHSNMFSTYQRLISEIPMHVRRSHQLFQQPQVEHVPERLLTLINMLETVSSLEAASILTEIGEFILLNNEDNLQNFPKRAFVTLLTRFIPPVTSVGIDDDLNMGETNAILACKALAFLCEALPTSAVAISRAVPNLLRCLEHFTVVDLPEHALKVLEWLAIRNQARSILTHYGIALALNIFDFLSVSAVTSVLIIMQKCAEVVRPFPNEYQYIVPFLQFAEKGINLQDYTFSSRVCKAIHALCSNFRTNSECVKQLTDNTEFVEAIQKAFIPEIDRNFANNKCLLLRSISSLCFGSSLFSASVLSLPNFTSNLLQLYFGAITSPFNQNALRSKYTDILYDILSLIDIFFSQSAKVPDAFAECEESSLEIHSSISSKYVWQWKDDAYGWQSYTVTECWIIETAYLNNYDEISPLTINNRYYTIDFGRMLQINEESGSARNVQRLNIRLNTDQLNSSESNCIIEKLVQSFFIPIYELSQNPITYSPLLNQRCWTILTKMMYYTRISSSSDAHRRAFNSLVCKIDIMNNIYSMLNSSCAVLMICALHLIYCLINHETEFEHLHPREQYLFYGIMATLDRIHDYVPPISRRRQRPQIPEHIVEMPRIQQLFPMGDRMGISRVRQVTPGQIANTPQPNRGVAGDSTLVHRFITRYQFVPEPIIMSRTGRRHVHRGSGAGSTDVVRMLPETPNTVFYEWIRLRSFEMSSQFRQQFSVINDPVLIELKELSNELQTSSQKEDVVLRILKAIKPETTVHQLVESSVFISLFNYLNLANKNSLMLPRIQHLIHLLKQTDNSQFNTTSLKFLTEKLISCVFFTEHFFNHDIIPSDNVRCNAESVSAVVSSSGQQQSTVTLCFNETRSSSDAIWTRGRIGPIVYPTNTKISEVIESVWYYHTYGWIGEQVAYQPRSQYFVNPFVKLDLIYREQVLDPKSTLADTFTVSYTNSSDAALSIRLNYRVTQSKSNSSNMYPQTWLLQTLYTTVDKYPDIDQAFKYPLLLLRFLSLLYKHLPAIEPNSAAADLFFANDMFMVEKLSSIIAEALQDPVRLLLDDSFPRWMRYLVYECFSLLPFETRQIAFYTFNLPKPTLLYRLIDQGIIAMPHGVEQFGRLNRKKIIVRRSNILKAAEELFSRLQVYTILDVTFEDEVGYGNGPTNEFFALVSRECQTIEVWARCTDQSRLLGLIPYPVPLRIPRTQSNKLKAKFRFIGKLLAKSIIDYKLLDLPLSVVVYKWLLREEESIGIHDMKYVDSDLYRQLLRFQQSLNSLKFSKHDADVEKNLNNDLTDELKSCYLNFTLPGYSNIEMVKNGRNKNVVTSNLADYINCVVRWRLVDGIRKQMEAMRDSFYSVIPLSAIKCFHADELHYLICGTQDDEWTEDGLQNCCRFAMGYTGQSDQIIWLFKFMCTFDQLERRQFIQFVTGTPCLPYGGIKALSPSLTIARSVCTIEGADLILPSVMTCKNYLKLPEYSSPDILEQRFNTAIQEGRDSFMLS